MWWGLDGHSGRGLPLPTPCGRVVEALGKRRLSPHSPLMVASVVMLFGLDLRRKCHVTKLAELLQGVRYRPLASFRRRSLASIPASCRSGGVKPLLAYATLALLVLLDSLGVALANIVGCCLEATIELGITQLAIQCLDHVHWNAVPLGCFNRLSQAITRTVATV